MSADSHFVCHHTRMGRDGISTQARTCTDIHRQYRGVKNVFVGGGKNCRLLTAVENGGAGRVMQQCPQPPRPALDRARLLAVAAHGEHGGHAEEPAPRCTFQPAFTINLRATFERTITRAGLKPWPRPFQNLRSSRATDWCEQYPIADVTRWLGNSPTNALKHSIQARDAHFHAVVAGADWRDAKDDARTTQ